MGIIKWLKKEWENNSRNVRRSSLPPKLPSDLNTATSRNSSTVGSPDPIRTAEYTNALSQFLERRSTLSPLSNLSTDVNPSSKILNEKITIDEQLNVHSEQNNEIKLSDIENVKSQIEMFHQNELNINDPSKSNPNNSNLPLKSKQISNNSYIKYGAMNELDNLLNNSDFKNDDLRNTSSSVNYEKFSFGNIHTSLDQREDGKTTSDKNSPNKISITSTGSGNASSNTLKAPIIKRILPKIKLNDENIALKLSTSFEIEEQESDTCEKSISPTEYFQTGLDDLEDAFMLRSGNTYRNPSKLENCYKSKTNEYVKIENQKKYIKKEGFDEVNNLNSHCIFSSNTNILNSPEDVRIIIDRVENKHFKFGPFKHYFDNLPIFKYDNLKWNMKPEISCSYHCEWKEAELNNMKILTRRVKPYSKISCEDLLETELKILSTIRHPNIVLLIGITLDTIYKIVPIYEHFRYSLYTHMYKMANAVSLQQNIKYTYQICEGLNYLHQFNLIHTAISSHNIILDDSLRIAKLCCFDVAISLSVKNIDYRKDTIRKKWYRWLSPELLNQENTFLTTSIDIYSLCLVFWECCIMKVPFQNLSFSQLRDTYFTWKMEIKIPDSLFPLVIYKMLTRGLVISSSRSLTVAKMSKMLQFAETQLSSEKDIFIFLKLPQFRHPHVQSVNYPINDNTSMYHKDFDLKIKTHVNTDFSPTISTKRVLENDAEQYTNIPNNNKNTNNEMRSNNYDTNKLYKTSSGLRIENTITFIRKPKNQDYLEHNYKPDNFSNSPNKYQNEQFQQTPKKNNYRSPSTQSLVEKQFTSLPTSPYLERKLNMDFNNSQNSLPNTPIAKNSALRKYKWLSENGYKKQNKNTRIDSDTSASDNRDPYTGLRKVSRKIHYNSDSQIAPKTSGLSNSIVISPIIDIRKIVETHESWIRDSMNNSKSSSSPSRSRSTAVKPASHRIEIVPELKPQVTAAVLPFSKTSKKSSSKDIHCQRNLYACMPTPIRDAVSMRKVLNEEMKNFFEGSLWKQEKIKCLSKMKNGVSEQSVLHNILKSESNKNENIISNGNNKNNLDQNAFIIVKPTQSTDQKCESESFELVPSFPKMNITYDKETDLKESEISDLDVNFIKNFIVELIEKVISKNKLIGDNAISDSVLFKNLEPDINCENKDILVIYEVNTRFAKQKENERLFIEENKILDTIHEVIDQKSSDCSCDGVNNVCIVNKKMNKTYDVVLQSEPSCKNDFKKCEERPCKSLECLNMSTDIRCTSCGSVINFNTERNETHSQIDMTSEEHDSEIKLKRCRGFTKIADIDSTEDIYFDDVFSPDNVACHMQLSPMSNLNISSMNDSVYMKDSSLMDEEIFQLFDN